MERRSLARCGTVIVLSRHAENELRTTYGIAGDGVIRCPAGVDGDRFRPAADRSAARRRLGLPAGASVLLTVRRLDYRMGLEALVDALARPDGVPTDALLLIVGDGPLRRPLAQRIRRAGAWGRVRMAGRVREDDLPGYYQAADLFVLPTRALEGFGMATLEALASALPVLGTPVGATPEILEPIEPSLVLPGTDAACIAGGIRRMLADRDALRALGAACRAHALQRYPWERMVDAVETAINAPRAR